MSAYIESLGTLDLKIHSNHVTGPPEIPYLSCSIEVQTSQIGSIDAIVAKYCSDSLVHQEE